MSPKFQLDASRLQAAVAAYLPTTRKTLPEVINQRALNATVRAFDALPPVGRGGNEVQAQRQKVQRFLSAQLSTRIRVRKTGKFKGQYIKKGARLKQLQRVNLIIQADRAKRGLPGLFGSKHTKGATTPTMAGKSGMYKHWAEITVGFTKSIFMPVIRGLNAVCAFKQNRGGRISPWANSAGRGSVVPARADDISQAIFRVGMSLKSKPGQEPKMQAMIGAAVQAGMDAEAAEMQRHLEQKIRQNARDCGIQTR